MVYLFLLFLSVVANAQPLNNLPDCNQISPADRQLALSLGYDIDSYCNAQKQMLNSNLTQPPVDQKQKQKQNPNISDKNRDNTIKQLVSEDSEFQDSLDPIEEVDETSKIEELTPYGYELFSGSPNSFLNSEVVTVPKHYVLGPDDTLKVYLYGKVNRDYLLSIDRNGNINFPDIGPITLTGLTFEQGQALIASKIKSQLIGIEANITIAKLRSIQVFVLGEAKQPGAYVVSALSNITNAMIKSGGVNKYASLRNITLKRNNQVIKVLDLYDLLLKGDRSNDARLEDGDVIFIPVIKNQVVIEDAVIRPAIYELKHEKTIAEVINLAGGISVDAFPTATKIIRNNAQGFKSVIEVNLRSRSEQQTPIKNGDIISVEFAVEEVFNGVHLIGHVYRERTINWLPNMFVSDLLSREKYYPADLNTNFGILIRKVGPSKRPKLMPVALTDLWKKNSDGLQDIALKAGDSLMLLNQTTDKSIELAELRNQLIFNNNPAQLDPVINITGAVVFPGSYPYVDNISLTQFIGHFARLQPNAYVSSVLILRRDSRTTRAYVVKVDLNEQLGLPVEQVFKLQPYDQIFVLSKTDRNNLDSLINILSQESQSLEPNYLVKINGEVAFPGTYPWTKDLTIAELITMSGGFTERTYIFRGQLVRKKVDAFQSISIEEIVIDLSDASPDFNIKLQPKDQIYIRTIPRYNDQINVEIKGEVEFIGQYNLTQQETLFGLVMKAGGFSKDADLRAIILERSELQKNSNEISDSLKSRTERSILYFQTLKAEESTEFVDTSAFDELSVINAEESDILIINMPLIMKEYRSLNINNYEQLLDYRARNPDFIKTLNDVLLIDSDLVSIPKISQNIQVIGEVQNPSSHLYGGDVRLVDYIKQSGGRTQLAHKRSIYVIHANGQTSKLYYSNIFGTFPRKLLAQPGDIIIVPINIKPNNALQTVERSTALIYQFLLSIVALRNLEIIK